MTLIRVRGLRRMTLLFIVLVGIILILCNAYALSAEKETTKEPEVVVPIPETEDLSTKLHPVPPPPFSEGIFPCSECHKDMETNMTRRELTDFHEEIKLNHGPRERWCFDCHNPDNRDELRLASGTLVPFTESYRLCGQCHGDKLRDWNAGVHGKRTGHWDGKKQYLLCAHCHNPHSPRFAPIEPMPAPPRPENLR